MSGLNDEVAQRQRFQAMYTRWSALRMQLGPAAQQNEEFISLSQVLQQVAARQRSMSQGQPQFNPNQGVSAGPNGMISPQLGSQPLAAGQTGPHGQMNNQMNTPMSNQMPNQMGNQVGGQMNYMPQMSQMPPQMGASRMQTPMNGQMGPQMGGGPQMHQMPGNVPMRSSMSPMSPHMPQHMNVPQMGSQMGSRIGGQQIAPQGGQMGHPSQNGGHHIGAGGSPMAMNQMGHMNQMGGPPMNAMQMNHMGVPQQMGGAGNMPMNQMNQMGQMNQMNPGQMSQGQMGQGQLSQGQMNQGQMNQGMMNQGPMGRGPMDQMGQMGPQMNGPHMDASHMRMGSRPHMMSPPMGMPSGFDQRPAQAPQQGARRPEARQTQEHKPRKPTKAQQAQQAQQAQAQAQQAQRAQLEAQQRAQQAQAQQAQAQARAQAQQAQEQAENDRKKEEENSSKEGLNWLNLYDVGGDLDMEGAEDLFGDADATGGDNLFYRDLYDQGPQGDDNGFMSALSDLQDDAGPVKAPAQPQPQSQVQPQSQPQSQSQPQPQPQPQPQAQQRIPPEPKGAGPQLASTAPGEAASAQPMGPRNAMVHMAGARVPSHSVSAAASTPTLSTAVSPAATASPQMMPRRTSADHTGSLLQLSPALSQHSFRGTPQATPVIPSRPPPSFGADGQPMTVQPQGPQPSHTQHASATNRPPTADGSETERRKPDQLLTPEEIIIMSNQEQAFKTLHSGQSVPESVQNVLFNPKGPSQRLPLLSQFRSRMESADATAAASVAQAQQRANLDQGGLSRAASVELQQRPAAHQSPQQQSQLQPPPEQPGAPSQQTPQIQGAGQATPATKTNGHTGLGLAEDEIMSPRDIRAAPPQTSEPYFGPPIQQTPSFPSSRPNSTVLEKERHGSQSEQIPDGLNDRAGARPPSGMGHPSFSHPSYNREVSGQMANDVSHGPQHELKKQHLEQHHMDQELSMKRLKQQQWQAQQRQEEMFRQRYGSGDTDDVAFVVSGGRNLSTLSRSRRLTTDSETPDGNPTSGQSTASELGFDRVVNPQSLIPKSVKFEDLKKHDELLTIPSLFPLGVSGQLMKFERRKYIAKKMAERLAELESKGNLTIDEEIEVRQLRLQPYMTAVRGDLLTHVQYFNTVAIDRSNRVHFARMKLLTQHDAALVERFVNEQALERRKSENLPQHLHLQRVQKHMNTMLEFRSKQKNQRALLGAKVVSFHQHVEREEVKRYERTAKQRLQLLRANDEEAYLKLIDQTKDARITHLLKQTNKFLAGLAKAVKDQQGGDLEEVDLESEDVREKIDYYEVAHRVKETVTEQPSILVGGKLKDYQLKGLQWMVSLYNNHLNGILADEMGLGKTIQSISLITYLIEKKNVQGPFLVLVPLSTLTNWNMEFDLWAPSVNKIVYRGPPPSRKALQPQIRNGDFQVLLTTYEYVIKERPLFSRIKWEHMIIDEGHRMKNTQSKLSSTLAQYYTSRYRLILTGTPLQNNLPELWALLNFVLPKIFNSVKSFEEWFNKPFAQAGSSDRMDLGEEEKLLIIRRLHKVLRPFLLRRLKKDVEQDLPDKVEKVIKCKKSAIQSQLYRQLLDHSAFALGSAHGGIRSLSNRVMQLRKLCNHPFVFEEVEKVVNPSGMNNDLLWRVSGKFELLDRILPKFKQAGHRMLMFFQMTQIMDIMEDFLKFRGIKYLRLDGTTKAESRSDLLRLFNQPDSEYFCFLLSTRAGGLGLNLQTADTVIIYDTDWNPHQDLQAQDRAHRIGQTKEVRILRLITENSIEENILERAQGKLDIDGKVIQAGKFDNKSTNEEQEAFLRTLLEAEESKNESKEDELMEMDDEELNSMLARSEEERELFHQMDLDRMAEDAASDRPRLFSEAELPEQYTSVHIDQKLSEASARELANIDEGGHHLRARRIGNWGEIEDDLPPRKRSKHLDESESPPLPTAAVQASAPPALPKPRTGRKGRPPRVKESMTAEAREQLTEIGRHIVKRMKSLTDTDGRRRIDLFLELPSRSHYPDYYQVIGVPMCVATIVKRINSKYYQSFEQLSNDWRIIFRNARWYNAEGSIIYNDANALEESYEKLYRQLTGLDPAPYVDVVGDQPEKLNLQRGLPTPGTTDTSVGANLVPKDTKVVAADPPAAEGETANSEPTKSTASRHESLTDAELDLSAGASPAVQSEDAHLEM